MNTGIKISRAGFPADTSDIEKLILSSENEGFLVAKQGLIPFALTPLETKVFVVNHNLGFVPFVLVYYRTELVGDIWQYAPTGTHDITGGSAGVNNDALGIDPVRITKNTLRISIYDANSENPSGIIRYFMFNIRADVF